MIISDNEGQTNVDDNNDVTSYILESSLVDSECPGSYTTYGIDTALKKYRIECYLSGEAYQKQSRTADLLGPGWLAILQT